MKIFFLYLTFVMLICFTFANYSNAKKNYEAIKSPLKRSASRNKLTTSNMSKQDGQVYLEMDACIYHEVKKKIKCKTVKSISDLPLYEDRGVTITNIKELETCVGQTVVYHGNERINRKPDIVAITGEIEGSGEYVFLSMSPRGAYGFTKDIYGDPGRSLKYSPNSEYTIVSDTQVQDFSNFKQINDIVELPNAQKTVFTNSVNSSAGRGLSQMSYYRIPVDTTANFLDEFDGDTEAAEDYIYSTFNSINPAFNEFNAQLYVNYIRLWPDGNDGYLNTDLRNLRSEFDRRWRNQNNPEYSIARHAGIILTKNSEGNTGGYGAINAICGGPAVATINYGVQHT